MRKIVKILIILSFGVILSNGSMAHLANMNAYGNNALTSLEILNDAETLSAYHPSALLIEDMLDQQQPVASGFSWGVSDDRILAQSFIPTLNVLTRVQIRMFRLGDPDSIKISIRSNLSGQDLTSARVNAELIPSSTNWITFDVSDIAINPGQPYYIIWEPSGSIFNTTTFYWDLADKNPYEPGEAWTYWKTWENLDISTIEDPDFCFKTYGIINDPPSIPTKPMGPSAGSPGALLRFESTILDPDGDTMSVLFDWGDDTPLLWIDDVNNGTVEQYHQWNDNGTYHITVMAKDMYHTSSWSDPLVIVIGNNAPYKPMTPSGPASGIPEKAYVFTTSAIDPDGHRLYYLFNWDDGSEMEWMGPFDSGQEVSTIHVWGEKGTYSVKVKVIDDPNSDGDLTDGIESVWSDPLQISMSKGRSYQYQFLIFSDIETLFHNLKHGLF